MDRAICRDRDGEYDFLRPGVDSIGQWWRFTLHPSRFTLPRKGLFRQLGVMAMTDQEADTLRRMSPGQKLAVMHALIRQAFELKAATVRARAPDLPEAEVRERTWALVAGDHP